jgi:nucleotide-binding universal stress UspA family protein
MEAMLLGKPLTLVHVLEAVSVGPSTPRALGPVTAAELALERETHANRLLEDAKTVAQQQICKDQHIHRRLLWGFPEAVLAQLTGRADLVVLGHQKPTAPAGALLNSTTAAVLQHARCPVAVVRDPVPTAEHGAIPVGVDGSPASEWAVALAFDEASRRSATLTALHAWTHSEVSGVPSLEESNLQNVGAEILAERLAGWQERYPDVPVHRIVVEGHPARQLVERSALAQLTIVGSRGRGRIGRLILGSVSSEVVRAARSPVIVTPSITPRGHWTADNTVPSRPFR